MSSGNQNATLNAKEMMAKEPTRVLYVNDHLGYADGVYHGVTTYFLSLLPRFDPSRVKVNLCIFRDRHPASAHLEAKGITPIFLNRAKWNPRVLLDLISVIRELGVHIVHLSGMKGILLGRIAARITGCRAIIELHDTTSVNPIVLFLHKRFSKWMDLTLTVSDEVSEVAVQKFGIPAKNIITMHTAIAVEEYANPSPGARQRIRNEFDIDLNAPVIGIVGRMMPMKGHEILFKAMPMVLAKCPEAKLLVVGNGPMRSKCEALVEELQIKHAVRFAGIVENIPDVLAAMDVFALPSLWGEGFGKAALEALAASKPVVGFPVPALPEFIHNGENGFLVPLGDIQQFGEALLSILTDSDRAKKMSSKCRGYAERFDMKNYVRRLEEIYAVISSGSDRNRLNNKFKSSLFDDNHK